nr:polysaccharide pyruvyl transferase family protein [uncultured Devosia sp.]
MVVKNSLHEKTMMDRKIDLGEIHRYIDYDRGYVFLDYAIYYNIGDLLITMGTRSFFDTAPLPPLAELSLLQVARIRGGDIVPHAGLELLDRLALSGATLVLQGGGNFGDLYPYHQQLRELIALRYPDNPILVLPQSIHFNDPSKELRSQELLSGHRNLTLLCRDAESLVFAEKASTRSRLMPDMAHHLWAGEWLTQFRDKAHKGRLCLLRDDKESQNLSATQAASTSVDWADFTSVADDIILRALRYYMTRLDRLSNIISPTGPWKFHERLLMERVVGKFASFENIETDRLHAMILACLLSRSVVARDNSYGKLSRYHRDWLNGSLVEWAGDDAA